MERTLNPLRRAGLSVERLGAPRTWNEQWYLQPAAEVIP